jgi:hypothetical protein
MKAQISKGSFPMKIVEYYDNLAFEGRKIFLSSPLGI